MDGKTHRIGGICLGIICAELLYGIEFSSIENTTKVLTTIGTSMTCAYWSDIDSKTSTISKKNPITSWVLNLFVDHRGIMHTYVPYIMLALTALIPTFFISTIINGLQQLLHISLFGIAIVLTIGMLSGVTSHLLLDMITTEGVPILWPIYKKKISIGKLNEKKHSKLVRKICIIATIIFMYYRIVGNFDLFIMIFNFLKDKVIELYELLTTNGLTQIR